MSYANSQGVRIHYEVEGDGSPLVLQHGFSGSLESWYETGYAQELMKDYRLILIDARGHGASDKPHQPQAYALRLRVSDVVTVLDQLKVRRAHYFGYSMGGRMGFGIARYASQCFHSLIIGGMHPYKGDREVLDQRAQTLRKGMDAYLASVERQGWAMTPKQRSQMLANDVEALIASTLEYRDWPGMEEVLPSMTIPSLLFVGEADTFYSGVQECVKHMPNVTFVSLPGLDHGEAFRRSDLVLPHIKRFLKVASQVARTVVSP